jgi:hypothetical protein
MDMKKTAKKIAALVAGTTMLGATIMGATALDLSNYPAPFVTDGVFSGKIVVGANAATSDVVGAIDLAASLQAQATKTSDIAIPGAAGTASVTGDSAEFKTGSDVVAIGETIGSVKGTFTELDLKALKSGVFETGTSSTPVKQYLKFDNTGMYVKYAENDDDKIGDFLYVPDNSIIFEYQLEFTEGAVSEIGTGMALDDFEGEVLTILGAPFTVVNADMDAGDQVTISMLGGQVADVLRDGETKTYTIDGKDYEVTAVFISSDSPAKAKLSVNGVMTKEKAAGETQVLSSEVTVGIQSILTNQREGMVEFYLGANKLELIDGDVTGTAYAAETVKVGGDTVSNAQLVIKGTNQSSDSEFKLNYIKYKVTADDEYFVPAGKGVKEFLGDYSNSMLVDTWDITYAGLVKTADSEVKFNPKSNYGYEMSFENINGVKYTFPLITNKDGTFKFGDDDDDFVFEEPSTITSPLGLDNETFISDNDYFVLSDRATGASGDTKAVTSIMRYQSINTGDSTITFKDLAGGDVIVSYTGTVGYGATGQLIKDGATHNFWVGNESATASEDYALAIDLDASGSGLTAAEVKATVKGKGIFDFGDQTFSLGVGKNNLTNPEAIGAVTYNTSFTTPAALYDEAAEGPETSNVTFTVSSSTTLSVGASIEGSGGTSLVEDPDKDDYSYGYTDYGTFFEKYTPTASSSTSELTVMHPGSQRYAQAFVTAGNVEVKEGAAAAAGTIKSTTLNPIAVGLAVLDTDPMPAGTNMIVVGGPCVNAKAAELMGNPADCAAGFTPGKAVIKLFADKNALLVAGYSAQDTLGASYVLAQYKDYKLSGTEVEVVVADLNTITVNKIQ